jgi:predicted transcriptional regulator
MSNTRDERKTWRFLSNHTQVLLCLHHDPDARFRDIAQSVGITERAAQRIVADLIESGYVSVVETTTASGPTSPCVTRPRTATRSASS